MPSRHTCQRPARRLVGLCSSSCGIPSEQLRTVAVAFPCVRLVVAPTYSRMIRAVARQHVEKPSFTRVHRAGIAQGQGARHAHPNSVAAELNTPLGTLKGWLKRSRHTGPASLPADMPVDIPAVQWTPAQRLLALHESHTLQGPALHA